MVRISKLKPNQEGVIREVEVTTPKGRILRRPVNLLVPLEIEGTHDSADRLEEQSHKPPPRYNLSKRTGHKYSDDSHLEATSENTHSHVASSNSLRSCSPTRFLFLCTLICAISGIFSSPVSRPLDYESFTSDIRCTEGGVTLQAHQLPWLELCSEQFCRQWSNFTGHESVRFPAEIILHEHLVKWKMTQGETIVSDTLICPASPFCSSMDCILCTALLFNPECWPVGAIIGTAGVLYILFTIGYVVLYIPLIVGLPCRAGCSFLWITTRWILMTLWNTLRQLYRLVFSQRPNSRVGIILFSVVLGITHINACQKINVFSHSSTICTSKSSSRQVCHIEAAEVIKINPFLQEACIKVVSNTSTLAEVRVRWKRLLLRCEVESFFFTRHTQYKVIDSKRCSHTGSCTSGKCTTINSSTLIPEFERGNSYPGNTYCMESCGGPGCECFYLSSGCLFYRMYLVPQSPAVYELFRCTRWAESVEVQLTQSSHSTKVLETRTLELRPNVPLEVGSLTLKVPALPCTSLQHAMDFNCTVTEECTCTPAETVIRCRCQDLNISDRFRNAPNRQPISMPSVIFQQDPAGSVVAEIPNMATAELVLNFNHDLHIVAEVTEGTCSVADTSIIGCYHCLKGAEATILCTSTTETTTAEVDCGTTSFTVPCTQTGARSKIRFSLNQARILVHCSVKCGSRTKYFNINGILKYATSWETSYKRIVNGESTIWQEISWPDIGHILDIYCQWYKTVMITILILGVALLITYTVLSTWGMSIAATAIRILALIFHFMMVSLVHVFWRILAMAIRRAPTRKADAKLL